MKYVFVDQNSPENLRFALGRFPRKNHSLILRFAEPRFVLKWPEHDLLQPLLLNPKKGEERTGSHCSSTTSWKRFLKGGESLALVMLKSTGRISVSGGTGCEILNWLDSSGTMGGIG